MIKKGISRVFLRRTFLSAPPPDKQNPGAGPTSGLPWYGPAVILVIVVLILAAVLAALGKHPNMIVSLLASAGAVGVTIAVSTAVSLRAATSRSVKVEIG
ncbi:hypothetical protein ABH920_004749 [Catenulispora sp. EB89]